MRGSGYGKKLFQNEASLTAPDFTISVYKSVHEILSFWSHSLFFSFSVYFMVFPSVERQSRGTKNGAEKLKTVEHRNDQIRDYQTHSPTRTYCIVVFNLPTVFSVRGGGA